MGRRLTQDEVISQFREVHGDHYDYSKFVYRNNRTPSIIICPRHGDFLQSSYSHNKGRGCSKCRIETQILPQDEVINKFRVVHGDRYDYSKFLYSGWNDKGVIICPTHGEFDQTPNNHKLGRGCPKCNNEHRTSSQDEVINKFRVVHGDHYDYSKFVYVKSSVKGIIICPTHGEFKQTPNNHAYGKGCIKCAQESAKGRYDSLSLEQRIQIKDIYLYHIELKYNDILFHKIGITENPSSRFSVIQKQSRSKLVNGWIHKYKNAEIAFQKEQKLLDYMMFDRSEKYCHPIKFGGHHECFLPVPNPRGWNLDLKNIPGKSI